MNRGKILIIDDREEDLRITKDLLEKVGYNVIENLGWLGSTNKIKNFKPDIVLLDINMPALSGENLYELLEKNLKIEGIPVLFYSSMEESFLRRLALQKRVDYIPKGDVFKLYKKISFYIKKSH
ncbi:response regulator [Thermodesulfovibrio sp. TK110]